MKRSYFVLSLLLAPVFLACTVKVRAQDNAEQNVIKIGAVLGLSGPASVWGKYARMGAELAIEEINSNRLTDGSPRLKLIIEDGRTVPTAGVSAFQKLVTQDRVRVVIGDVWAFITQPMIPLANRSKIILLSPTVVPESVKEPGEWFYSMGSESELSAGAIQEFFNLKSNLKRVAIFCWDDPWGESVKRIWLREIKAHGMTVVREVCVNDFNYDYRTDITRLSSDKADIILISYHADKIIRALRERKISAEILSTEMIEENLLDGSLPWEAGEGVYAWLRRPGKDFQERFRAKYGEEPGYLTQNSYDAVYAVAEALKQTGDRVDNLSLRALRFDGATGLVDFRSSSWGNRSTASLFQIKGHKMTAVNFSAQER